MTDNTAFQSTSDNNCVSDIPAVEVKNLVVHYETKVGVVEAVNNVSFKVARGETLGLVGETGAGKTTIALSIMGLLPKPPSNVIQGNIYLNGEDLGKKSKSEMQKIRGKRISMIFQDPMTALNPVLPVGEQIAEVVRLHDKLNKKFAMQKAMDMLQLVGILPERYKDYPHQFSGGMKQRAIIALALACNPDALIADEPTTALDVTIQAQVLELMRQLQEKLGTSLIMITHDFGVVADICDKCAVIYAGEIVEMGTVQHIFDNPKHPYTLGLFGSLPSLDHDARRLVSIRGLMIDPMNLPAYCSFYERCDHCSDNCSTIDPGLVEVEPGHVVKCALFEVDGGDK